MKDLWMYAVVETATVKVVLTMMVTNTAHIEYGDCRAMQRARASSKGDTRIRDMPGYAEGDSAEVAAREAVEMSRTVRVDVRVASTRGEGEPAARLERCGGRWKGVNGGIP